MELGEAARGWVKVEPLLSDGAVLGRGGLLRPQQRLERHHGLTGLPSASDGKSSMLGNSTSTPRGENPRGENPPEPPAKAAGRGQPGKAS